MEIVDGFYYHAGFFISENWADGDAQFLLVNALGDGHRQVAQLQVALLLMRWDGVVDERLDTAI